jgi:hypothetical protein
METAAREGLWPGALESMRSLMAMGGGELTLIEDNVLEMRACAIGTLDQICEHLLGLRESYGFSYFSVGFGTTDEHAVIGALNG